MNNYSRLLLVIFAMPNFAIGEILSVDEIAQATGFLGHIKATDKTEEISAKSGDSVLSAVLYEPEDDGFSRIQVLITKGGFLMNDPIRSKLQKSDAFKKFEFGQGGFGFIGIEGAGPGGEGHIAFGHLPKHNIDVQIKFVISNDGVNSDKDYSSAYHSILRDQSALQRVLGVLAEKASESHALHRQDPEAKVISASSNDLGAGNKGAFPLSKDGSLGDAAETKADAKLTFVEIGVLVLVMALIAYVLFYMISRKKRKA